MELTLAKTAKRCARCSTKPYATSRPAATAGNMHERKAEPLDQSGLDAVQHGRGIARHAPVPGGIEKQRERGGLFPSTPGIEDTREWYAGPGNEELKASEKNTAVEL